MGGERTGKPEGGGPPFVLTLNLSKGRTTPPNLTRTGRRIEEDVVGLVEEEAVSTSQAVFVTGVIKMIRAWRCWRRRVAENKPPA